MEKIRIAFNGFGRIGRNLVRKLISDDRYIIVAINAKTTVEVRAHLFKYDSVHGQFQGGISYELDNLIIPFLNYLIIFSFLNLYHRP